MDRRAIQPNARLAGLGLATVPLVTRAQSKEAHYYTWAGYELPEFHQSYIDEHGVPPGFWVLRQCERGHAEDSCGLSHRRLSSLFGQRHPVVRGRNSRAHRHQPSDPLEGLLLDLHGDRRNAYPKGENLFIPFEWGNSSILYRTDLVDIEEESWSLLFDERYKGKLATYNAPYPGVQVPAMVLGYKNLETLSDEQLAEVRKLLEKQREVLRFYGTASPRRPRPWRRARSSRPTPGTVS